ncbi:hypothetical protein [Vibrio metschnikovii]|uniref:hypothetical protein n=1 Tax=Vibrio metschnikovii TaxID=28172 RepID=UPI001C304B36|nr:hypothetical protein [Vibrio metschnikovii]
MDNNSLIMTFLGVVGAVIAVAKYVYTRNKDKAKIKIFIHSHPKQAENIEQLHKNKDSVWDNFKSLPVYQIEVKNVGFTDVNVIKLNVVCSNGIERAVRLPADSLIKPQSRMLFDSFLDCEDRLYTIARVNLEDATGKKSSQKA